ncbi:hypothetical protein NKH52_25145 [Mesorhizobium sp. M1066]|uniref:hypothetical protein n=1 Tax=unclassified Mesorhizobium TaxID=325217 RepID=UPI003334D6EB
MGIFLIRDTLATNKEATDAAKAAVTHATETAKLELRAYLTAVPDGINQLIRQNDVMGHVLVKNVGRLPAQNVTLLIKMERSLGPEFDSFFRRETFDLPKVATNSDRVIHPGSEMRQGSEERIAISDLCLPEHNVYVYGIVSYHDGYGVRRSTRFCHRYATASRDHGITWDVTPNQSRTFIGADKARYHNYGNSAD